MLLRRCIHTLGCAATLSCFGFAFGQAQTGANSGQAIAAENQGAQTIGKTKQPTETQSKIGYSRRFALVIGCNYGAPGSTIPVLHYAEDDARAIRDVLTTKYGFARSDVKYLIGPDATKDQINQAIDSYSDGKLVKEDDLVIIFFSGHGASVKSADQPAGFLIPYDAKVNLKSKDEALPYLESCVRMSDDVWGKLTFCHARHILVMADACFGGLMATRGGGSSGAGDIRHNLSLKARQTLSAGEPDQETTEIAGLGHGIFTRYILDELNARATSKRAFRASDLYYATRDYIAKKSNNAQTPVLADNAERGDVVFFPVGAPTLSDPNPSDGVPEAITIPMEDQWMIGSWFRNRDAKSDYQFQFYGTGLFKFTGSNSGYSGTFRVQGNDIVLTINHYVDDARLHSEHDAGSPIVQTWPMAGDKMSFRIFNEETQVGYSYYKAGNN